MLRNCTECWQVFDHPHSTVCPACRTEFEEQFSKVKDYLRKHPGSNVATVVDGLNMPLETIRKLVNQDKLKTVRPHAAVQCSVCGREVFLGTVCKRCAGSD